MKFISIVLLEIRKKLEITDQSKNIFQMINFFY